MNDNPDLAHKGLELQRERKFNDTTILFAMVIVLVIAGMLYCGIKTDGLVEDYARGQDRVSDPRLTEN